MQESKIWKIIDVNHGNKVPASGKRDTVKNGYPCFGPESQNVIGETFRSKKLNEDWRVGSAVKGTCRFLQRTWIHFLNPTRIFLKNPSVTPVLEIPWLLTYPGTKHAHST